VSGAAIGAAAHQAGGAPASGAAAHRVGGAAARRARPRAGGGSAAVAGAGSTAARRMWRRRELSGTTVAGKMENERCSLAARG
jgi:hypothetical protein